MKTDIEDQVARRIFNDEHAGLKNCYDWDTGGLEAEHPGTTDRYLGYARSAIAVLSALPPAAPAGDREAVDDLRPVSWYLVSLADGTIYGWSMDRAPLDKKLADAGDAYFHGCRVRPLYAAPPAQPAEESADDIAAAIVRGWCVGIPNTLAVADKHIATLCQRIAKGIEADRAARDRARTGSEGKP